MMAPKGTEAMHKRLRKLRNKTDPPQDPQFRLILAHFPGATGLHNRYCTSSLQTARVVKHIREGRREGRISA
jgi:hypothetical protein